MVIGRESRFFHHPLFTTHTISSPREERSSAGSLFPPVKLLKPIRNSLITADATPSGLLCHWECSAGLHRLHDKRQLLFYRSRDPGLTLTQTAHRILCTVHKLATARLLEAWYHGNSTRKPAAGQILELRTDPLNQKFWVGGPAVCPTGPLWVILKFENHCVTCYFPVSPKTQWDFQNFHCTTSDRCLPLSAAVGASLHPNLLKLPTAAAETGSSLSFPCGTSAVLSPDGTLRLRGEL